jgi:sugar lactone lactonase YvrE
MANDKDFILKNAIEIGGSTKVTIGDAPASGSYAVGYTDASLWAYSSKSFSVTSQETDPAGFAFKSDGTKMYLIGRTNDTVYQYSLSTAWDVSTSSYDSVSFLSSSQTTNPACLIFKPDGTKMYILDYGNDDLFQYSLSTAWDISTASYDSVLFDPSGQETTPRDFKFNSDGTKIFLVGSTSDTVHQYSLSTAYNVGTANYDSVSFSVTGQTTFPGGIDFNADASKMYIFNYYNGIIYQYSLPSAYDIANAVYDNVSFTITQDTNFGRFRFSYDGTSLYVAGTGNDTIY